MRKWTLSKEDIFIKSYAPNDLGIQVAVDGLTPLSLAISNTKMRYVHCAVKFLAADGPIVPSGNNAGLATINYSVYPSAPPSLLFRTTHLLSGIDKVPVFLLGASFVSTETIPLLINPGDIQNVDPNNSWSRYSIQLVAPSITDFVSSITRPGAELAWVCTIAENYLAWLLNKVALSITPSSFMSMIMLEAGAKIYSLASTIASISLAATNKVEQAVSYVIDGVIEILKDPLVKRALTNAFVNAKVPTPLINDFFSLVPLAAAWSTVIEVCNVIQSLVDLSCPAYGEFVVDIPIRREPCFRFPGARAYTYVNNSARAMCPIELALPDGKLFTLASAPKMPTFDGLPFLMEPIADAFSTSVKPLADDDTSFEFSQITVLSKTGPESLPVVFTVSAAKKTGNATFTVRPPLVDSAVGQFPAPAKPYLFTKGIGHFMEAITIGSNDLTITAQLEPNAYPHVLNRTLTTKVNIIVENGAIDLSWNAAANDTFKTGGDFGVPLDVKYPAGNFSLLERFSAEVDFNIAKGSITLNAILPDSVVQKDPNHAPYPIRIEIETSGKTATGDNLVLLEPQTSLLTASQVKRVYLPSGLQSVFFALHPGTAFLKARLSYDFANGESKATTLEKSTPITIKLGTVTLDLAVNNLLLDDDLEGDFGILCSYPDTGCFNTLTPFLAQVTFNSNYLILDTLYDDPKKEGEKPLPVNLDITRISGTSVDLQYKGAATGYSKSRPELGSLKGALLGRKNGPSVFQVKALLRPDFKAELSLPDPVDATVCVAPPLEIYDLRYLEGTWPRATAIDDNGIVRIWEHNTITLQFEASNYSPKSTVHVFMDLVDCSSGLSSECINTETNTQLFTLSLAGIKPGSQRVDIIADKPANFGIPTARTFFIEGLPPLLTLLDGTLQAGDTGSKNARVHFTGNRITHAYVTLENSKGKITLFSAYHDDPTSDVFDLHQPGVITIDQNFQLEEGDNRYVLHVENPIESIHHDIVVKGLRPYLKKFLFNGTSIPAGDAIVYDTHVEIEGIAYLASSLLFEPYTIKLVPQPQGEFKFGVDLKNEGKTYTKLTIGNDFGTTSYTVYINLPPLKWIYNFEAGFSRVKTNDKIYVYKYLNNKVVAQYENVIDVKGIKVLEELSMSEASSETEIKKKLPSFLVYTARESLDSNGAPLNN